jgi:alginate O-acetyltransferase complex protein AlgI
MVFNSWAFVPFFILSLAVYYSLRNWRLQKASLLGASYLFYGFFHPPYILILVVSTLIDFNLSKWIARSEGRRRKLLFIASLISNLGMLAYFKYAEFALTNFNAAISEFGISMELPVWDIILPVGISYYTFQTLSYTIDVYRKKLKPSDSILDFAFFVAFFPQLVAGPIVRAFDFMPQTQEAHRSIFAPRQFGWGLHLLIFGLFGKIVLADRVFAPIVDQVYKSTEGLDFWTAWAGTIAFSGQIFFDFAGYSTSAIGVALCYGFALPDNFRFPYAAAGFSDFWRRWHISLSQWLRDYLYISLGGNKKGVVRTYINLSLTMILGGLWHGAAWTFVIWGVLHASFLIIERLLQPLIISMGRLLGTFGRIIGIIITYICICYSWVFFRASSFSDGVNIAKAMSVPSAIPGNLESSYYIALLVMLATLIFQWSNRNSTIESIWEKYPGMLRAVLLGGAIFLILATRGEQRAFIYFQF